MVALGASAGGHQALWEFFANLPHVPDVAFIVIQHLKADVPSTADQLLTRYTNLPIAWAKDQQPIQPYHIYLLPPGKYMTVSGTTLQVIDRDPLSKINRAIDIFFRSLADQYDGHSIGIILSGAGSDGTQGAIHMHQQGGQVLVQDPATAEFSSMPVSAIVKDHIKLIAAPQELAYSIKKLVNTSGRTS
ncbi:MAG: chemotaxis protein CheB [Sphingobacteriaceae bacterium]|nr:MAG: chemotaxis protein CheB [Sphingobacteriaceae bacterium]